MANSTALNLNPVQVNTKILYAQQYSLFLLGYTTNILNYRKELIPMQTTTDRVPNRLVNEKSPYLLQHAYNPVDWFPWCEEAFQKAKQEDKPIFLSIGYS